MSNKNKNRNLSFNDSYLDRFDQDNERNFGSSDNDRYSKKNQDQDRKNRRKNKEFNFSNNGW